MTNSKEISEIINILNNKHKQFLEGEGKWLGGSFDNIFIKDGENRVKLEIVAMLPQYIKKDILEYFK